MLIARGLLACKIVSLQGREKDEEDNVCEIRRLEKADLHLFQANISSSHFAFFLDSNALYK